MKRFFSEAAQNEKKNSNEVGISDLGTLETEATSDWSSLSEFKVTYHDQGADHATAQVYRNGRQQVPIKVVIQGRNNKNEVVPISPNDLAEIQLVVYSTGLALPAEVQYVRTRNVKYDYFPENLSYVAEGDGAKDINQDRSEADLEWQRKTGNMTGGAFLQVSEMVISTDEGMETLAQEVSFWVTTTTPDTIRIAAKITKQGAVFQTRSPQGGAGMFDSSVTIIPITPVAHVMAILDIRRRDEIGNDLFDVDIYDIFFRDPNLKIRDSIHFIDDGNDWHYSAFRSNANKVQTAYKADAFRVEKFNSFKPGGGSIEFYVNYFLASEGKATASRIIDKPGASWSAGRLSYAMVSYIDNFGNSTRVRLVSSDDGNGMFLANP